MNSFIKLFKNRCIIFSCACFLFINHPTTVSGQSLDKLTQLTELADEFYPSELDSARYYSELALSWISENEIETEKEEQMLDLLGLTYRRLGDASKSEKYFLQAIALSLDRGNNIQLADSYNRIGLLYRGIGRLDEAISYYHRSISLKRTTGNVQGEAGSWNNLGSAYRAKGERDSALISYQKSIELREKLGDARYLSSVVLNMGNWLLGEGNFVQAREYYDRYKEIQISIGDTNALAMVNSNIGALFINQSMYDSALTYYLESTNLIELADINDPRRMANNFLGIGGIYEKQGYQYKAIEYYQKSLEVYKQFQDPENKSIVYQNIGKVYSDIGIMDSSLRFYQLSLEEAKALENPEREAVLLNNLGVLHNQNKDYELSLDYSQRSAAIYELRGDKRQLAEAKFNIGASWFYLKRYRLAISEYVQSLQLADETENLEMQERATLGLAEAYGEIGDYENAFKHQVLHNTYKDSLLNSDRVRAIEELITKYETERVEAENELLVAQQSENEAIIQQRNAENRALIFGLVALVVAIISFIAWVVYSNRKKRIIASQKESLYQNKIDSLLNQQQLESVSAMLEGQEKERKRLAAELHDRLGSILSLVKLYFSSMDEDIKHSQPDLYGSFTEGNQFLDDAFVEVRALIKEMKEGASSGEGLKKDIEVLIEKISKLGIEVESRIKLDKKLNNIVELNVFRVVQEALSNSLKYSKAENIELELSDGDHLSVMIRDNGVGFDPNTLSEKQKEGETYGVENMENRVKLLGGEFLMTAENNKGVTINVNIPLIKKDEVWGIPELN